MKQSLCVLGIYTSAWCRWDYYKLSTPTFEADGFNFSPQLTLSLLWNALALLGFGSQENCVINTPFRSATRPAQHKEAESNSQQSKSEVSLQT